MNDEYPLADEPQSPPPDPTPPGDAAPPLSHPAVQATGVHCTTCGYNLTGVMIGGTCPECGSAVDPSLWVSTKPVSGYAITSMVLGIVSLTTSTVGLCCGGGFVGLPCGVLGLLFWRLAREGIQKGTVGPHSRGMNTAGLVCNIIGTVFSLAFVVFFILAWINEP